MDLPEAHEVRAAGRTSGRPKKRFGQHFLKDPNTARIVAGDVGAGDVVLEIGAGRGFLTEFLARRASFVHALEVDEDVVPTLARRVEPSGNVRVHIADALRFDYGSLSPRPGRMVANLPYNVASPLVLRLLEEQPDLFSLRFMVQLEVARRMASGRGVKDYGAYAVLIQVLAEPRIVHRVPPTVFEPPPRVYSAVVDLKRRDEAVEDYAGVKSLVLAAFANRRKRLVNNLGERKARAVEALERLGVSPDSRAEELSPEDFVALHGLLKGWDG